jgi:hypothetical protein
MSFITSSRLRVFRRCRREHHFRYVLGRASRATAAQDFGTLVHLGLESWWGSQVANLDSATRLGYVLRAMAAHFDGDPFDLAKAEALLIGYNARWGAQPFQVLAVEAEFRAELPGALPFAAPERLAGKLDVLVRDQLGRVLIIEHKTSSEDISPGSTYWARLRLDGQVSLYYLGAEALGHQVEGVLYDVLGKPALRPAKASASPKLKKDGQPYAGQRLTDETPEEYRARIVAALAEDPERYFARAEVVRLEAERERHLAELQAEVRELAAAAPLPNPDSCTRYGSTCAFFGVCTGERRLEEYEQLTNVHPELSEEP